MILIVPALNHVMCEYGLRIHVDIQHIEDIPKRLWMELVDCISPLTAHSNIVDQDPAIQIFQNQCEDLFEVPCFTVTLQET